MEQELRLGLFLLDNWFHGFLAFGFFNHVCSRWISLTKSPVIYLGGFTRTHLKLRTRNVKQNYLKDV